MDDGCFAACCIIPSRSVNVVSVPRLKTKLGSWYEAAATGNVPKLLESIIDLICSAGQTLFRFGRKASKISPKTTTADRAEAYSCLLGVLIFPNANTLKMQVRAIRSAATVTLPLAQMLSRGMPIARAKPEAIQANIPILCGHLASLSKGPSCSRSG